MAAIKLTNVKKIYDKKVTAVHDFNLDVADKEFIVFVGPSGCGKSTTLRMIAGLEEISGGTCEIDGKIVNDLPPKDRDIAMVFQNYALYPHLTVFENIAFPLRLLKTETTKLKQSTEALGKKDAEIEKNIKELEASKAEGALAEIEKLKAGLEENKKTRQALVEANDDAASKEVIKLQAKVDALELKNTEKSLKQAAILKNRIEYLKTCPDVSRRTYTKISEQEIFEKVTSVAETLGITEYLTRKPRALSGGQRQRVAIGRAMVRDSKVLLMDEPLSNLDAKLRNQMRAEIILLRKKIDATFIYVTHDQTEAMTLGDRIVIMKDGFIQQIGTPSEVFDTPANLFVAGFIGAPQMNFFEGAKLIKDNGEYAVDVHGQKFPVDGKNGEILKNNGVAEQEIILGVRPEHMSFSLKAAKNASPCTLLVSEMMGSELHLHLQGPNDSKIIARVQTMNLTEEERKSIVPGQTVYVGFESKVMHLFDMTSDTRRSILHPENEYVVND